MSKDAFDANCSGCQPTLLDFATGSVLASDDPRLVRVLELWKRQPLIVKWAWHRVMCGNSRDPLDLYFEGMFTRQIVKVMRGG